MDAVITVRVSRELQTKMKKYKSNWSQEVRAYIESRLKNLELREFLKKTEKTTKSMKVTSDSTLLIREDRDSR